MLRGRHAAGWAVVVVALVVLLPGEAIGAASGWTRTDVGAITQPAPIAGRFVVYAHRGTGIAVVALNARTGKTAWSATASSSNITAGVPAFLTIARGQVFYLAPASTLASIARLTARDAATGRVTWRSAPGIFDTWPALCPDQSTVICVSGTAGTRFGELRFSTADGKALQAAPVGTPGNPGRPLADALYDPGQRSPELLVATDRGRVTWTHPVAQIFTFKNPSSDGGWNLERLARRGIFVGSVGTKPLLTNGKEKVNLGVSMTAAFTIDGGRVRWRTPGLFSCRQPLPCPGSDESGYYSPGTNAEPTLGIRMVEHGTAIESQQGLPVISRDAGVTLQGFDLLTGKTRWSYNAGRNVGLIEELVVPARIDVRTVAIRNSSGQLLALDLVTGKTRAVASSTPAWCQKAILYHANGGYYAGRSGLYVGQDALYPCTVGGKRLPAPSRVPALVGRIGATIGGITAWTDASAVHAGG